MLWGVPNGVKTAHTEGWWGMAEVEYANMFSMVGGEMEGEGLDGGGMEPRMGQSQGSTNAVCARGGRRHKGKWQYVSKAR